MQVREQMTHHPVTVTADDTLTEARARLATNGLKCLPVVEDGRLVGLVFARDLPAGDGGLVKDLMVEPTARVHPGTPIERAAALMLEHGIHGLPVVDRDDHLEGVLTVGDLLATIVKAPPIKLWG